MAVRVSLGKGEPIANDDIGTPAGEVWLDEGAVLRLEDLTVGGETVCDQTLAVAQSQIADERAVWPRARPFTEEMRDPGHAQVFVCLAKEP